MRGDEAEVVKAFRGWLAEAGWTVETETDHCDVVANRGSERLYAEAKGDTTSRGLDVDTLYGQLLRRIRVGDADGTRYGVVVRPECLPHALRVPQEVRRALRIDVYSVARDRVVTVVRPDEG